MIASFTWTKFKKSTTQEMFLSPNLSLMLYKTTMKHKTATSVQLNICGISEHNKTVLENF